MGAIGRAIKAAFAELTKEENSNIAVVDEWLLKRLTDALQKFFSFLVYEGAYYNKDLFKVVYRRGEFNGEADVLEIVFRNFLRETYNLSADAPLFVWVYLDEERLYLFQAYTEQAKIWLQDQRNSVRSRMIQSDRELLE